MSEREEKEILIFAFFLCFVLSFSEVGACALLEEDMDMTSEGQVQPIQGGGDRSPVREKAF